MKKWMRLAGTVTALVLTASVVSAAGPAAEKQGDYLVGFGTRGNSQALAAAGVRVVTAWEGINAAHVKASSTALARLQANGVIEYYEADELRHKLGHGSLPYSDGDLSWGLQAVHAQEAWNAGATGTAIKVCVLDTGIDYNHPAFVKPDGTSVIKGSKNFVSDGHPDAKDGDGHGTHVAGTIAGQNSAYGSKYGVAPNVELYVGRVLGDDGSGASSGIINGVNWCADTVKANVISMSLGGGRKMMTEQRTYDSVWNKGVLTIAAAGNDGNSTTSYPAGYKNVVSVAAVDPNLARASFSQYNSDVELAGPGVVTLSSVPLGTGVLPSASEDGVTYTSKALEFAPNGSVTGPLVECGLADSTTSCTGKPASGAWVALVSRGVISFADKVTNAKAQGASAVIVTNNDTAYPDDAGSFTLGAEGNWIPTVSVSYNSGVAIRNGGLGTGTVSLTAADYDYFQGTSMATPHVSAVAALAWSAKPTLSNATVLQILQSTAKDLGAAGRDTNFGYGLVQADAAVAAANAK